MARTVASVGSLNLHKLLKWHKMKTETQGKGMRKERPKFHYICKICQRKKVKLDIEQFIIWNSKKEIIEHIKRKHPNIYKEVSNDKTN